MTPFARAFLRRIQNDAGKDSFLQAGTSLIVGVSGGPDSLCLLDTLALLREKRDLKLRVAHINYRLRGRDSDRDEARVTTIAQQFGLPCHILHPSMTGSSNLEERLRNIRYAYFERLRRRYRFAFVAVGHTQDDQAETFLLRLLRGSGLQGLSAMRSKRERVVRPILNMSRPDILRYLKERKLRYRVDKSNTDLRFLRNRIRRRLIPLLERDFQPQIKKRLARTACLLSEEAALLASLPPFPVSQNKDTLTFSCAALLAVPEPLARKHLRDMFLVLLPSRTAPSSGLIAEVLKALKSTKGKIQTVTMRGLKLVRKGDTVTLLNSRS